MSFAYRTTATGFDENIVQIWNGSGWSTVGAFGGDSDAVAEWQRAVLVMSDAAGSIDDAGDRRADPAPMGSVCWWHLLMDNNGMGPCNPGWRVRPSLGDRDDRQALRQALRDGTIQAISVHAVPLDEEDMLLPTDQRPPGLSGHHLVLPALWDALIRQGGFQIRELWQALSFGPSAMLNQPVEVLREGSRRWLLFDPDHRWTVRRRDISAPSAANVPLLGEELQGRVIACGLSR